MLSLVLLLLLCSTDAFLNSVMPQPRSAALLQASNHDLQSNHMTMLDLVKEDAADGDEDLVHVFAALEVSCCFHISLVV